MSMASVISIRDPGAFDLMQSLLHQGITVRIQVSGNSMQPFLKGGEIVEIAPLDAEYPKIGDIVLFRDQHGNPLLHRLIRRRYHNGVLHLQTKGDACTGFDRFIPAEQVFGHVRRIFTDRGAVHVQTPLMRLRAYALAGYGIFLYTLRRADSIVKKQQLF